MTPLVIPRDMYVKLDLDAMLTQLRAPATTPPDVLDLLDLGSLWVHHETAFDVYLRGFEGTPAPPFVYSRNAIATAYGSDFLLALDHMAAQPRCQKLRDNVQGVSGSLARITWRHLQRVHENTVIVADPAGDPLYLDFLACLVLGDIAADAMTVLACTYHIDSTDGVPYAVDYTSGPLTLSIQWFERYFPGARERFTLALALDLPGNAVLNYLYDTTDAPATQVLPPELTP